MDTTPEKDQLVDLVKRLARVRAPDRDLDSAIWRSVHRAASGKEAELPADPAPITGSIDAALDLLNRIRPGWVWKLQRSQKGGEFFKFTLEPPDGVAVRGYNEAIPALAVVDALLRSLLEHGSNAFGD
jgi:hypothetical protein